MNWHSDDAVPEVARDAVFAAPKDTGGGVYGGPVTPVPMGRAPEAITIDLNPLSSFSVNTMSAQDFAGGGNRGLVFGVTVPANRIFSLASTGPGALREGEVVVIGGPLPMLAAHDNVAVWTVQAADGGKWDARNLSQSEFYNQ
jgi:hypothetical protein